MTRLNFLKRFGRSSIEAYTCQFLRFRQVKSANQLCSHLWYSINWICITTINPPVKMSVSSPSCTNDVLRVLLLLKEQKCNFKFLETYIMGLMRVHISLSSQNIHGQTTSWCNQLGIWWEVTLNGSNIIHKLKYNILNISSKFLHATKDAKLQWRFCSQRNFKLQRFFCN